jgi:hypothetical protein
MSNANELQETNMPLKSPGKREFASEETSPFPGTRGADPTNLAHRFAAARTATTRSKQPSNANFFGPDLEGFEREVWGLTT